MRNSMRAGARRSYRRQPAGWAVQAAKGTGRRPTTYEAAIHGKAPIHVEVARCIRGALAVGDTALVGKIMLPIQAALAERPVPAEPREQIQLRAQNSDLTEDQLEAAFNANPCRETRRPWIAARRAARANETDLDLALEAEDAADA